MPKDFLNFSDTKSLDTNSTGPKFKSKILRFKYQFFKGQNLSSDQELEINFWIEFFSCDFLKKLDTLEEFVSTGFQSVRFR